MTDWTPYTARASQWFEELRNGICAEFEAIEREAGSDAAFEYTPWQRDAVEGGAAGETGGGTRGVIKGKVFEKAGVNISSVHGALATDFAGTINGASAEQPSFSATGISLVAHMANPHVPAVHMNTRFLTTTKAWFGGGADLNPPLPYDEDTAEFHAAFKAACDAHDPGYYPRYKKWADDYFYIPHRQVHRGVGGIFYDHLECSDEAEHGKPISLSPARWARPSSRCSRCWCGGGWEWNSRPRRSSNSSNGAGAMPSSTWSMTAAHCSA